MLRARRLVAQYPADIKLLAVVPRAEWAATMDPARAYPVACDRPPPSIPQVCVAPQPVVVHFGAFKPHDIVIPWVPPAPGTSIREGSCLGGRALSDVRDHSWAAVPIIICTEGMWMQGRGRGGPEWCFAHNSRRFIFFRSRLGSHLPFGLLVRLNNGGRSFPVPDSGYEIAYFLPIGEREYRPYHQRGGGYERNEQYFAIRKPW